MKRNANMNGMAVCCCCGEVLHIELTIDNGSGQRICVECADAIDNAYVHQKELFADPENLPVVAVVKLPYGIQRKVVAQDQTDDYFYQMSPGVNSIDGPRDNPYNVVTMTKEEWERVTASAATAFAADPMLRRACFNHRRIAERMVANGTGHETEAEMRELLFASWKSAAECYFKMWVDEIHDESDWQNRNDVREFINSRAWIPYPNEEVVMSVFHQMITRAPYKGIWEKNAEEHAKKSKKSSAVGKAK